jgi:histidinol-phosphate aminotransferase
MSLVPANIEALSPYQPGKPLAELERELGISGAVKLASNENPIGPSPRALAAVQAALGELNRYPDGSGHALRSSLAARHRVSQGEIMLGAGSNELIELLIRTFCDPQHDEVLSFQYAFMMYKLSAGAHGVRFVEAAANAELGCDVDALLARVTPATKLVLLPNPNNPTGSVILGAELERLVLAMPAHVVLAVDEAYVEYAQRLPDYAVAEPLRQRARCKLVTLRTFSKIYGLAGLRVGYAVADAAILDYMNRVRMPFNVSSLGMVGAVAALEDEAHVQKSQAVNAAGLAQLGAGLGGLGVTVYPSAGNFVLVDVKRPAAPVFQALLQKGVIVRPLAPSGLMSHLRISVATEAENARAIKALAEVLAKTGGPAGGGRSPKDGAG